jgi:hypothetical protein
MSYLAIASGYDLVSFVWARPAEPTSLPRALQNTFHLPPDWEPVRLIIELNRPPVADNFEDPERWDGLA